MRPNLLGKPWTRKELDNLLGALTFEHFERQPNGCIYIAPVRFWMRVGTWFGKPVQAIIAESLFIRVRDTDYQIDNFVLHELDPAFIRNADDWKPKAIVFPFYPSPLVFWAGNMVMTYKKLHGMLTT